LIQLLTVNKLLGGKTKGGAGSHGKKKKGGPGSAGREEGREIERGSLRGFLGLFELFLKKTTKHQAKLMQRHVCIQSLGEF
jgi:hypothetical protein